MLGITDRRSDGAGNTREEWVVRGLGVSEFFSAFGCRIGLAVKEEEERQSWVDEHGKAFTKSGSPSLSSLLHPQNPVSF